MTDAHADPAARGACAVTADDFEATIGDLIRAFYATSPGHPGIGLASADPAGKDVEARAARAMAGSLVWPLVAWALHHHVGLLRHGLRGAPLPPRGCDGDAEYAAAAAAADDHAHELAGASFNGTPPEVSRQAVTVALRNLLPEWLPAIEVADALDALAFGEVRPVLSPPEGKRARGGTPFALWGMRVTAVRYVAMLQSVEGLTKEAARARVGDAYGVAWTTVRDWETELPGIIGEIQARDVALRGRALGSGPLAALFLERLPGDGAAHRAAQRQPAKGTSKRTKRRAKGISAG